MSYCFSIQFNINDIYIILFAPINRHDVANVILYEFAQTIQILINTNLNIWCRETSKWIKGQDHQKFELIILKKINLIRLYSIKDLT